MSNYSGTTTFKFMVERYKDKSGQLLTEENSSEEDEPIEVELEVEGRSFFESGRYTGAWEDCYPDEGETEIMSVIGPNDSDWENLLTKEETASILEIIQSNVQD